MPMMHQSSMGTVVVLLGHKLSPLWQSTGEILVTLGIFSLEIILYLAFVKYLPVLHALRRA